MGNLPLSLRSEPFPAVSSPDACTLPSVCACKHRPRAVRLCRGLRCLRGALVAKEPFWPGCFGWTGDFLAALLNTPIWRYHGHPWITHRVRESCAHAVSRGHERGCPAPRCIRCRAVPHNTPRAVCCPRAEAEMPSAVGTQRTALTDCSRIAPELSVTNPLQAVCEREPSRKTTKNYTIKVCFVVVCLFL